ncbi:MAG: CoA-binding protein [Clostridia bacterium]|nr:CoA-binding protein [Clostridia bacterium]
MDILQGVKTIAVVGISDKPERPSHQVAQYLQQYGFKIIPINPMITEVLGEKAYSGISAVPAEIQIDLVDIFRKSEDVLPIVAEAVERGVRGVWLQEGVINEEAAELAKKAGLKVEMDKCIEKELKRLAK